VDDFGTGFASLQQLMRAPFTELKIDQGFVTGCSANAEARVIVESSVEMARKLGIASVAEGVESLADWNVVKATGCDMAQGHYIARPMDEASFMEFCANPPASRLNPPGTASGT
jgi:EAL domain-containing protein (putative c-di-GMP-specific phosphodiesterase class I)